MKLLRDVFLPGLFSLASFSGFSQRTYSAHSVLATGNWYKIAVKAAGIYKIDIPFLANLGLNTSNLSSASVRLFGNGGKMLSEANAGNWMDDLAENAVQVVDGGDGILNGNDYILFFAPGPDEWVKDSFNLRFSHQKNLYSEKAFYFLTIGGTGKRISPAPLINSPSLTVTGFSERIFHELDTINFLASGKEWFGEEFTNAPGKTVNRSFIFNIPGIVGNTSLLLQSNCAARSAGVSSRFDILINNQPAGQQQINAVNGGQYDLFVQQSKGLFSSVIAQDNVNVTYNYIPGSFNSQGWLNWFELFVRRSISLKSVDQLLFRDWLSVGNQNAEFIVDNAVTNSQVWDITYPLTPQKMQGQLSGNEYRFVNSCNRLREYIAFNNAGFLLPEAIGKITNQDLHNSSPADLLIVTHSVLSQQAQRLAQFHQQQNGLRVQIVTTEQVYNEFGSGSPDPASIRDVVKMYYDKYGTSPVDKPRYLLLFGDASFDYKDRLNNNTNLVPAWQSSFSTDPISTHASDDFFGFLDNNEDINSGLVTNFLDIGIGRIPAKNITEAKNFVDKVEAYFSPQSFGPWRNNLTFIADDEDGNLHLQDAEIITSTAAANGPVFNLQKIYLDAFRQESGAGGSWYPLANQAINNQVYNGTLIWNYNGHGGSRRLADETILDQDIVNGWNNPEKLPLFITATCDFAPYDNPTINSIGENILLRPKTGAIALMTTTRLVFAFSNRVMNTNYLQFALQPDASGKYKSLGDAVKEAKNYTYQTSADVTNNRKFTLLGDPAMTLAFPILKVRATRINGVPVSQADTLSAMEKISIEGEVTDQSGTVLPGFTGNIYPMVFDKPQTITTLANDPGSQVAGFQAQNNILFRGKASVTNGQFNFSFRVPKDINYQYGNGKLSLYAENAIQDGHGMFSNFVVGGVSNSGITDKEGPSIKAWLNDELFANGGLTNQTPVLILKIADSSGINTAGTGIGHDIVAILDNDNNQFFILNDYFQGELDSYQLGSIRFQLPELSPGPHSLQIKAWDIANNSTEIILNFTVANDEQLELSHILNYPNPFSTSTNFWFEHNKPGQQLLVQIQIMTITGRVVKSITTTTISGGSRVSEIKWDGKDDFGDRPGRGVYLYKLRVITPDKMKKEVIGKLVLL